MEFSLLLRSVLKTGLIPTRVIDNPHDGNTFTTQSTVRSALTSSTELLTSTFTVVPKLHVFVLLIKSFSRPQQSSLRRVDHKDHMILRPKNLQVDQLNKRIALFKSRRSLNAPTTPAQQICSSQLVVAGIWFIDGLNR